MGVCMAARIYISPDDIARGPGAGQVVQKQVSSGCLATVAVTRPLSRRTKAVTVR